MGKKEKKQRPKQQHRRLYNQFNEDDGDALPSSAYNLPSSSEQIQEEEEDEDEEEEEGNEEGDGKQSPPSKFLLYQKSVQSPKGDISYLQKFFLMYVGRRYPLHLQEDFCGTALLSAEWLCSDPRRTAAGVDLDLEALTWCLENNVYKIGADGYSRISLFHGNVLQPSEVVDSECTTQMISCNSIDNEALKKIHSLPARDVVCAFNYSCCCLQRREDLVLYFKHALSSLSKRGGIFAMDLYGGTSSERKLRLQRRFSNFTYVWEQEEFDILNRTTRISLHFQLGKNQGTLRHAFTYSWRLWSLPEIKDCLEEAGFRSVHFWIREMPNTYESAEEFNGMRDVNWSKSSTSSSSSTTQVHKQSKESEAI
ncbi:hypothetical protein MRB53_016797 [Persea americana]|uniref:Uncharacterized protein n=1 Tax=Persea americana TaxID=3435 RepID=A0ACC2M361_PERAE|nr:hypothetical protein MRB53_016797 [Persea americana]